MYPERLCSQEERQRNNHLDQSQRNQTGYGTFQQILAWADEQGQDTTHPHPEAVALVSPQISEEKCGGNPKPRFSMSLGRMTLKKKKKREKSSCRKMKKGKFLAKLICIVRFMPVACIP